MVAADVYLDKARETAEAVGQRGGACVPAEADVSRAAAVDGMIGLAVERFGRLDILVNSAGILLQKSLLETTEEEWNRVLSVNLTSAFLCAKRAIPEMLKVGRGKIINIASVEAVLVDPYHAAYAASKAGIEALTKSMALEFARKGIGINCVCPGAVRTNIAVPADSMPCRTRMDGVPLGYMAEPEQIARVVAFLASDASDYIVAESIVVDGGFSKNMYPFLAPFSMHRELVRDDG